ncbi:MAG: DUF1772 domain-containing protein [Novacetimonas hansenii]|uniref:DUF1772 domain-containing protein n=1 Tax=Novacetimonas hansenii TaxID=436 RepID=UPI0039EACF3D
MSLLCRMLAIIGPAMFAGVMLAIGVIFGNYWKSLPPEQFLAWFAHNGEYIQKAIPPVVLPALIGLVSMIWIDLADPVNRLLWTGAALCIAAVIFLTLGWFVPANTGFSSRSLPLDQVSGKLDTWLRLHNIRIALAVAASALGVWACNR